MKKGPTCFLKVVSDRSSVSWIFSKEELSLGLLAEASSSWEGLCEVRAHRYKVKQRDEEILEPGSII